MNAESPANRDEKTGGKPDPLTGAPGFHPLGTGVGAAGGATAGAMIGVVGGPIGVAAGAAAGAVLGGLTGKAIAEKLDPAAEDAYWINQYQMESYYEEGLNYDDYGPAYRYGLEVYAPGSTFDEVEELLAENWSLWKGKSFLSWHRARDAVRASWERADRFSSSD